MKLIQAFEITTPPPGKRSPPKEQENEAGSVLIVSVNKNKILYRPRTADPSTLTTDNLLTLANIITTSGIEHHCPPSLGVLTSVQITMLYLQENIRQQTLAGIFGTSQPTISRAINNVLGVLDVVLPPPPRPKDLNPQRLYVLDGTLVPCWWWKNARNLVQRETPQSRTQPANTHRPSR